MEGQGRVMRSCLEGELGVAFSHLTKRTMSRDVMKCNEVHRNEQERWLDDLD